MAYVCTMYNVCTMYVHCTCIMRITLLFLPLVPDFQPHQPQPGLLPAGDAEQPHTGDRHHHHH